MYKYESDCRIYKYTANIDADYNCPGQFPALIATFDAPNGTIIDYGFQNSKLVLWMYVNPKYCENLTKITRILIPTGSAPPKDARYVKTLTTTDLVYHMFIGF